MFESIFAELIHALPNKSNIHAFKLIFVTAKLWWYTKTSKTWLWYLSQQGVYMNTRTYFHENHVHFHTHENRVTSRPWETQKPSKPWKWGEWPSKPSKPWKWPKKLPSTLKIRKFHPHKKVKLILSIRLTINNFTNYQSICHFLMIVFITVVRTQVTVMGFGIYFKCFL